MSVDTESLRKAIDVGRDLFGLSEMVLTHDEVEMVCDEIDDLRAWKDGALVECGDLWILSDMTLTNIPMKIRGGAVTVRMGAVPKWWKVREWWGIWKWLNRCQQQVTLNGCSLTFAKDPQPTITLGATSRAAAAWLPDPNEGEL